MPIGRRQRIWLAQHRVDFRKQHSGLLAEVYKMGLDPFLGDVVIFVGKSRRMLKVLYADPTGLFLTAKLFTMEAIKTNFRFVDDALAKDITQAELSLLLEGSRYVIEKKVKSYQKPFDQLKSSIKSRPSSLQGKPIDESPIA